MSRDCINDHLLHGRSLGSLKLGNIKVHKKDEPADKENYKPVTILPLLSKIFERLIYDQLDRKLEQYLSSLLCGYKTAHSTQHALFRRLQEWQNELDKCSHKALHLGCCGSHRAASGIYLKPLTACHMTCWLQNLRLMASVNQD